MAESCLPTPTSAAFPSSRKPNIMVSKPPKRCWGDSTDSPIPLWKGTSLGNLSGPEDSHESEAGTAYGLEEQAWTAGFQHPNRRDARKMVVSRDARQIGRREMFVRKAPDLTYADITPRSVYLDRRKFLRAMGVVGATAAAGQGLFDLAWPPQTALAATEFTGLIKSPFSTTEKQNTLNDVSHYNNFYEFGSDKSDPAKNAQNFKTSPWTLSVEGEVKTPRKFTVDEILK